MNILILMWVLALVSSEGTCLANNLNVSEESVRNECGYTRYPALCVRTLSNIGFDNHNVNFLSTLVNKTISETTLPYASYNNLFEFLAESVTSDTYDTFDNCKELMEMSSKRLKQAMAALQTAAPETHKADIQTWLSAAMTFQESCRDAVAEHLPSGGAAAKIHRKMAQLSQLASNALALANRISAGKPPAKPSGRRLLRAEFPSWLSAAERRLLQATGPVRANAVVAKDGSGNYKTVAAAVEAAGGGRFVIFVKAGRYEERIYCKKDGITLIGEGKYLTVITAGRSVGEGSTLRGSATFTITGDGFIARDIGFENIAGPESHQAVALTVSSDRSVFFRCSVAGYQDTLYAHSLRQFYRECDIYGTVDFIFGNAAAVFQSCTLLLRRPRSGGAFNTVTANGRSDPGQNTGFSIHNSKIAVAADFAPVKSSFDSYLGRPWKPYSRTVVMQTAIDGEISPRGWLEWEGSGGSTYRTLYYAEYQNTGPGSGTSGRVSWPGFHVIGTPDAGKFTVGNFIGGNAWLPSTGVTFVSGL
ncbi:pectinesterase [Andrographis paniculata]|uniref:pectinesterase n=1 Tax=Andrographis paniculata TaxID=175694 RepID=UPI0021E6E4FA|nr:pectinesterase [Andrographis paniculata]